MAVLKKYDKQTKSGKLVGSIPSGVQSGDSNAELMVVDPLVKHPEIEGVYRAVDPTTGWKGWVKYTPTVPVVTTPTPTAEDTQKSIYLDSYKLLKKRKEQLDLGLIDQAIYDSLKAQVLALGKQIGEL